MKLSGIFAYDFLFSAMHMMHSANPARSSVRKRIPATIRRSRRRVSPNTDGVTPTAGLIAAIIAKWEINISVNLLFLIKTSETLDIFLIQIQGRHISEFSVYQ